MKASSRAAILFLVVLSTVTLPDASAESVAANFTAGKYVSCSLGPKAWFRARTDPSGPGCRRPTYR